MRLTDFLLKQSNEQRMQDCIHDTVSRPQQMTYELFCRQKMVGDILLAAPTSDAEAVDILTKHLLPDGGYIVYSFSREQTNTEIVASILKEYPRRSKYSDGWYLIKAGVKKIWQSIFS